MPLLDDLAATLAANSAQVVGTDLFVHEMPDTPILSTVLLKSGDEGTVQFLGGSEELEQNRCQVVCRATSPKAAETRAQAVYAVFKAVSSRTISGTVYVNARALQTPFPLGPKDERGHYRWVFNCEIWRLTT